MDRVSARVFVGVPTWERSNYVGDALGSVLAQTFEDFRVVVSDNASGAENGVAIEAEVSRFDDPRVSFHRQPTNEGEYGQGRFFLAACESEYFVILHDDDRLEPSYLETAIAKLDGDPSLACFAADSYAFHEDGRPWPEMTRRRRRRQRRHRQPEGPMDMLEPHLRCGFVPISGTVFRTRALVESEFAQVGTGNFPFEFDVLLRVAERGGQVYFSREPLFGIRFHDGSMRNYLGMWTNPDVVGGLIRLLEPRLFSGADERRRRRLLATLLGLWARIEAKRGAPAEARLAVRRALRLSPTCHQAWSAAASVFLRGSRSAPERASTP